MPPARVQAKQEESIAQQSAQQDGETMASQEDKEMVQLTLVPDEDTQVGQHEEDPVRPSSTKPLLLSAPPRRPSVHQRAEVHDTAQPQSLQPCRANRLSLWQRDAPPTPPQYRYSRKQQQRWTSTDPRLKTRRGYVALTVDAEGTRARPGGAGAAPFAPSVDVLALHAKTSETNNTAELTALLLGVESAAHHGTECLAVEGDSHLILSQVRGAFAYNNRRLRSLRNRVQTALRKLNGHRLQRIDRKANQHADGLAKRALDLRRTVTECDSQEDDQDQ
ncbi:hypothetical protein PI124_g10925 [Phytophthora idaei]|nr:hypothetical protein PI125_g10512 [Phytophthora idaei]KAG3153735.1 hypothetical protein PI126_g9935 [Phytophthora idaei]KAG3244297.1 hypothetical protein PI124_g10925 [Phytophthora idaei]